MQHIATILWRHHGQRLRPQEEAARQYHPIAAMHPCESSWWYACHQNRSRPRKVLDALTLLYG